MTPVALPRFLFACASVLPMAAQIPATFKNLQLLPKDIPRGELVATMRGMAGALGVRCTNCHVGPDNLQGMDFATDEKDAKRAARVMIQMTRAMNADYMSKVPPREGGRIQVTCHTCHRAGERPQRPLEEILYETAAAQGVPAALEQHKKFRDEFYGSGFYDFRERTLTILATRFLDNMRPADALAVLKANLELFPKSPMALANTGQLSLTLDDRSAAESYFRRALEVDPKNGVALRGLEALKSRP